MEINGSRPWDIQVHNENFYNRVLSEGTLGIGESYMDSWWDCDELDEMMSRLLKAGAEKAVSKNWVTAIHVLKSKILNLQTKSKAKKVAEEHYDIGDNLYMAFLDPYNQYTCGYFKDVDKSDLNKAQENKMDLICRKIKLKSSDRVLDIGCGWGGLLRYAAKNYGIIGTGISPADNQIELARERNGKLNIEYFQMDYRDLSGKFDRIVSVGMMEHVGPKNLETFFDKCISLLETDGMMLHHTISSNETKQVTDPFFDRYIFPGGVLPSLAQISKAVEKKVIIEDVHNFGPDYDKTLMQWHTNINKKWKEIPQYDHRFRRMWNYYLLSSAAGFRARHIQLIQVVFRPMSGRGAYKAVR